jgi:hypothetical protein
MTPGAFQGDANGWPAPLFVRGRLSVAFGVVRFL